MSSPGNSGDRLPQNEAGLREFLAAHPDDVQALQRLAGLCAERQRLAEAQTHLTRVLEIAPGTRNARWMLACTLVQANEWESALGHLDILLEGSPGDADFLSMRAHTLLNLGYTDAALTCFETLVEKHPEAVNWMFYGYALGAAGRTADCVAAHRHAIELDGRLAEAYWSLSNLKTYRFSPQEIIRMREALDEGGLDARNTWLMRFALGKALEDTGQYPESFAQYEKANALFRRQLNYSAEGFSKFVRRTKALFTAEFLSSRSGMGAQDRDPVFIVGLPRSGSTLLEQILSSHSMVEGTRELTVLNAIAQRIADFERTRTDRYPEMLRELDAGELRAIGEEYIARTRPNRRTARPYFIDKTPGNFHHIGLIRLILPNARIVDARRHPLGCGFAVFRQYFPQRHGFAFDLGEIGRYYRDYVEMMAHFDAVAPGSVHRVLYEDMVERPEAEIRRLLEYLELPFEEACLNFHQTRRAVMTPSAEQVRQPIFTDALGQWRNYEPWLGPLKSALGGVLAAYPGVPDTFDAPRAAAQWTMSASFGASLTATLRVPTGNP
jgi:tetratricopeptide (TPR) repeat protein